MSRRVLIASAALAILIVTVLEADGEVIGMAFCDNWKERK